MLISRDRLGLAALAATAFSVIGIAGQQQGAFTAAQATAGAAAYKTNCAGCHQADLRGQGTAAQLAGAEFRSSWGNRSTRELQSFMQLTMPPGAPGSLGAETYANIAAFILQSNGARPGNQALAA